MRRRALGAAVSVIVSVIGCPRRRSWGDGPFSFCHAGTVPRLTVRASTVAAVAAANAAPPMRLRRPAAATMTSMSENPRRS
jgi:hypothetical protein